MSSRPYGAAVPLLIGYDPCVDLPLDHLSRFVDNVVEASVPRSSLERERGRPSYDLRLCLKVLIYGYATGVRSSRQLERLCHEHLAYLYLTRGDTPSYRTLCTVRITRKELLERVWASLFKIARKYGIARLGRVVIDSSKFRADAGSESVLDESEYTAVLEELRRILAEVEQADIREEEEGGASGTRLGRVVSNDQMRDILRGVRSQQSKQKKGTTSSLSGASDPSASGSESEDSWCLTDRMLQRVEQGAVAIEEAIADGRKHLCLTDSDARMMPEGIQKKIRECYSFEVAADAGLIVTAQTTQNGCDQQRLEAVVAAAAENEPNGIIAVDADSGYFSGDAVTNLIRLGIDTCIPDGHTACDLHRGDEIGSTRNRAFGTVPFTYDEEKHHYTCPEGNMLKFQKSRKKGGQMVNIYLAQRECTECPLATACLKQKNAKRRQFHVGHDHEILKDARQRFEKPEHQERYHKRGPAIETIFGFLRGTLGYTRWSLRGDEKVACEGTLFKLAYQIRKIAKAAQTSKAELPIAA